jgi:hypothetical protein
MYKYEDWTDDELDVDQNKIQNQTGKNTFGKRF